MGTKVKENEISPPFQKKSLKCRLSKKLPTASPNSLPPKAAHCSSGETYMRGRTLDDSFIILDEAQNTTREQMKMFLTRLGFGSKIVITGDVTQIDLPADKVSGLKEAVRVLEGIEDIAICRLTASDVVRHALVQKIVAAYDKFEQDRAPFVPRNHTERGKNHGTPDRRHV